MPVITVSAIAFIDPDGKVLTVRKRGTTSFMLPGGKPEHDETAVETAIREVREELGVRVSEAELTELGVFDAAAANEPDHVVRATVFTTSAAIAPHVQAEIEDARWVELAGAIDDASQAPLNRAVVFPLLRAAREHD